MLNQSKAVERKLREAAKELNCKFEDIWEDLASGYVDNIPSEKEIIEDINYYVKERNS